MQNFTAFKTGRISPVRLQTFKLNEAERMCKNDDVKMHESALPGDGEIPHIFAFLLKGSDSVGSTDCSDIKSKPFLYGAGQCGCC